MQSIIDEINVKKAKLEVLSGRRPRYIILNNNAYEELANELASMQSVQINSELAACTNFTDYNGMHIAVLREVSAKRYVEVA